MKKNFLILKGSYRSIFLIKKIRKYFPGSKIFLVDKNKKCLAKKYSDIFIHDDAESYQLIKKKILNLNIFICVTRSSGKSGLVATKINNFLNYNNSNIKVINKLFSGYFLSNLCKQNKLNYINTSHINKKSNLAYPLVIKADVEKIGKKNVFYVRNEDEFKKNYNLVKKLSVDGRVIAQDYIEGSDITILGYSEYNRKFLVKKIYKEINKFKKNGTISHKGFVPITLSRKTRYFKIIKKTINKIVLLSNLLLIPINFNFRLSKNKIPYLNEFNLFFGGENLIENNYDFISNYFQFLKNKKKEFKNF